MCGELVGFFLFFKTNFHRKLKKKKFYCNLTFWSFYRLGRKGVQGSKWVLIKNETAPGFLTNFHLVLQNLQTFIFDLKAPLILKLFFFIHSFQWGDFFAEGGDMDLPLTVCLCNCVMNCVQYERRPVFSPRVGPPGALNPRCSSLQLLSDVQHARRAVLCLCISHPFPPADTSPT